MTATDSAEWLGIMRDIIDEPGDDSLRMIAADWLEDNGDPLRAEFIRLQLELDADEDARICEWDSRPDCHCRPCVLTRREREILKTPIHPQSAAFAWSQPIHETGVALGRRWPDVFEYRRGFVWRVRCTMREWAGDTKLGIAASGPIIARALPLERVEITDRKPYAKEPWEKGQAYYRWRRTGPEDPSPRWRLPDCLFSDGRAHRLLAEHASEEAACDVLSDALIAWARSQP
jgi:uncharacterized protein (TIGR02996 family)